MSDRESREAFVTLATNDTYSLGCLVLGSSLKRVGTTRKLVIMVSKDVSQAMRAQLAGVFDFMQVVDVLDSKDPVNLSLLGRPDLNVTFTKFHCWRLTQFDKCVFLDADTLILQNVDELFDREELSAAPDAGWPDCFNSGVFVYKPSDEKYQALLDFATSKGSFDGGDQGLLNTYFSDWASKDISKHLPFIYNVVSQAFYSYLPAFTQFKSSVKIVHFIGAVKPWHHTYNTQTKTVTPLPGTGHSQEFLQVWWNIFMSMVQPSLDPSLNVTELTKTLLSDLSRDIDDSPERVPKETPRFHKYYPKDSTVHTVYPYKIPDDVEVFYDVKEDISSDHDKPTREHSTDKDIVDLPVLPREYTELESHYSEEPLSHIDPDEPPGKVYDVKKVFEGWEKGNSPCRDTETISDKHTETYTEELRIKVNKTTEGLEDKEKIGLCGDLAKMSVQEPGNGDKPDLSDAERKLNWEKGQIDYLGQDSYDNIQKKIQENLEKEGATAAPTSTTSPFTSTTSEPAPAKPAPAKPAPAKPAPAKVAPAQAQAKAAPAPAKPAPAPTKPKVITSIKTSSVKK